MDRRSFVRTLGVGAVGVHALLTSDAATAAARPQSKAGRPLTVDAKPAALSIDAAKTAVIVVDMQNDFGTTGGMFDRAGIDISGIKRVIAPCADVIAAARRSDIPIVYLKMAFHADLSDLGPVDGVTRVRHSQIMHVGTEVTAPDGRSSRILIRDTWNSDIVPELTPRAGDTVVYKTRFSGFYRTDLDERLRELGIKHLVVIGCTTSVCVESTVRDAMFRDYQCVLLGDCMAEPIGNTFTRTNHEASLLTMQALFGWVSDSATFIKALA